MKTKHVTTKASALKTGSKSGFRRGPTVPKGAAGRQRVETSSAGNFKKVGPIFAGTHKGPYLKSKG